MPYFSDLNLLGEEENPSHVQISGSSGTTDTQGNPSAGGNQAQKPLNTGSGFQNLDSYLKTNDAQGFGNQVIDKVDSGIQQAKQNQTDAAQQFKAQVSDSSKTPTSDQVSGALANPSNANPSDFQSWMKQSYQGPNSLSENQADWNKYWSGTNQAKTQTQQLGSEPGRFTLLDSFFGKPTYSFGEKSLDNLLLQGSGLGAKTQGLQDQAAQLKSQGAQGEKSLQDFASNAAGNVEASAKSVQDQYNTAVGNAQTAVTNTTSKTNTDRGTQYNQLLSDLSSNRLTPDELNQLGIGQGTSLYNITDQGKYLTQNAPLTEAQAATPEERARLQALSDLAGVPNSYLGSAPVTPNDPGFTFDKAGLTSEITAAQAPLQRDIATALASANPLNADIYSGLAWGPNPPKGLTDPNADPNYVLNSLIQGRDDFLKRGPGWLDNNDSFNQKLGNWDNTISQIQNIIQKYHVNNTVGAPPEKASKPTTAKGPR